MAVEIATTDDRDGVREADSVQEAAAQERPDSPPPADTEDDVFVAGFLVVYDEQDGPEEYRLDRETIRTALPPTNAVPININHDKTCTVGRVVALIDDPIGLLCVGTVSGQLAPVLLKYAPDELFGGPDAARLDTTQRFLYLLSNILPSLSLSSRRLKPGEGPGSEFFAHVSLCELGKRNGTIAIYGRTTKEAIAPFDSLSSESRRLACESDAGDGGEAIDVAADSKIIDAMMSKFMGAAFLMDRGARLRERRAVANIRAPRYLQASAVVGLNSNGGEERGHDEVGENGMSSQPHTTPMTLQKQAECLSQIHTDRAVEEMTSASSPAQGQPQERCLMAPTPTPQQPVAVQAPIDYIYVPCDHYARLVSGSFHKQPPVRDGVGQQPITTTARSETTAATACVHSCGNGPVYPTPVGAAPAAYPPPFATGPHPQATYGGAGYAPGMGGDYPAYGPIPGYGSVPGYGAAAWGNAPPQYVYPRSHAPAPAYDARTTDPRNSSSLDARLDAILDAIERGRDRPAPEAELPQHHVQPQPGRSAGARGRRRHRDEFEDQSLDDGCGPNESGPYFPGEGAPARKQPRPQAPDNGNRACDQISSTTPGLSELLAQLASLQRELANMRNGSAPQAGATPAAPAAPTETHAPPTAPQAPACAAAAEQQPSTVDASGVVSLQDVQRELDRKREAAAFAQMMSR